MGTKYSCEIELPSKISPVKLIVTYNFFRGHEGYTSGPPEKCYPPEPDEFDITDIEFESAPVHDMSYLLIDALDTLFHDTLAAVNKKGLAQEQLSPLELITQLVEREHYKKEEQAY